MSVQALTLLVILSVLSPPPFLSLVYLFQDGFAACRQMRSHELKHDPKIIAVTALSSAADKFKGQQAGVDDWRVKPVSMRELRRDLSIWRKAWEERKVGEGEGW